MRVGEAADSCDSTGQLDHPGIVPVHELGLSAGDRVYFTMRLVSILTSNGKLLAASLSDGDALLDLLYDPGRISIDLPGWRVTSIEGFSRGKLRTPMDVHRVWMEPSR